MLEIYLSPEMLSAKAKEVRGLEAEQVEILKRLDDVINSLNEVWKGDSQTSFVEQYNGMKATLQKFTDIMEEYAVGMDNAVQAIQDKDQELARTNASMFGNL